MRLFTKLAVVLAAITFAVTTQAADKKLLVATDTAMVPFEFKQDNNYVGFDIDLWDAIAKELKVDYELRPMDFDGIIPALQTGNIDVAIAGITITDARKKVVLFSDPYYQSSLSILVHTSNQDIKEIEDLNGKIVATQRGSSSAEYIKDNLKTKETKLFPNTDNAFMDLTIKRADAVLYDTPTMLYYMNISNNKAIKFVGKPVEAQDYGIAFTNKNEQLRNKVNQALKTLRENGIFDKINAKWFGNSKR